MNSFNILTQQASEGYSSELPEASQRGFVHPLISSTKKNDAGSSNFKRPDLKDNKPGCIICLSGPQRSSCLIRIPCSNNCHQEEGFAHPKCLYDWCKSCEESTAEPTCPLCRSALDSFDYEPPSTLPNALSLQMDEDLRRFFVSSPIPKQTGPIRCYIRVRKGGVMEKTSYDLFYQPVPYKDGTYLPRLKYPKRSDTFLLTAKNFGKIQSCFAISLDVDRKDFDLNHPKKVVGKLCGNARGKQYTLFGKGKDKIDEEILAISYKLNRLSRCVSLRSVDVCLPKLRPLPSEPEMMLPPNSPNLIDFNESVADEHKFEIGEDIEDTCSERWEVTHFTPSTNSKTLAQTLENIKKTKNGQDKDEILSKNNISHGKNKEPFWNEDINAFSLSFSQRNLIPSRKNFQLLIDGCLNVDNDSSQLQFGKILKGEDSITVYAMDIAWPLTILQGFGMCLSAIESKN